MIIFNLLDDERKEIIKTFKKDNSNKIEQNKSITMLFFYDNFCDEITQQTDFFNNISYKIVKWVNGVVLFMADIEKSKNTYVTKAIVENGRMYKSSKYLKVYIEEIKKAIALFENYSKK